MRRIVIYFALFVPYLVSCTTSATSVADNNRKAQAVMTGGVSLLNADAQPTVRMQISGEVFLGEKCQFLQKHFTVEIFRPSTPSAFLFVTNVTAQNTYILDVGLPNEGEYEIRLIDARGSKVIETKSFTALKSRDRLFLNFQACPE